MDHQRIRRIEPVVSATTCRCAAPCSGGDVGNFLAPVANQILVAVQGKGDLAASLTLDVMRRLPTPGCLGLGFGLAHQRGSRSLPARTTPPCSPSTWRSGRPPARRSVNNQMSSPTTKASNAFLAAENGIVSVYDQRDEHLTDIRVRAPRRRRPCRGRPEHRPHLLPGSHRDRRTNPAEQAPSPDSTTTGPEVPADNEGSVAALG
ncbi:hypothetical protein R1X32_11905 [Rhodococcus opacus]